MKTPKKMESEKKKVMKETREHLKRLRELLEIKKPSPLPIPNHSVE